MLKRLVRSSSTSIAPISEQRSRILNTASRFAEITAGVLKADRPFVIEPLALLDKIYLSCTGRPSWQAKSGMFASCRTFQLACRSSIGEISTRAGFGAQRLLLSKAQTVGRATWPWAMHPDDISAVLRRKATPKTLERIRHFAEATGWLERGEAVAALALLWSKKV